MFWMVKKSACNSEAQFNPWVQEDTGEGNGAQWIIVHKGPTKESWVTNLTLLILQIILEYWPTGGGRKLFKKSARETRIKRFYSVKSYWDINIERIFSNLIMFSDKKVMWYYRLKVKSSRSCAFYIRRFCMEEYISTRQ